MAILDYQSLTLGEIEVLEDELHMTLDEVMAELGRTNPDGTPHIPPTKTIIVFAWLLKHHDDPTFTMAQARALPIGEVTAMMNDVGVPVAPVALPPPTDGPAPPA